MDYFSDAHVLYRHEEWHANGDSSPLPSAPFIFYHYTIHNPLTFSSGVIAPKSFWCSVKTADRLAVELATGIGHYPSGPMYRVEFSINSVDQGTAISMMVGAMRWPEESLYPGVHEYIVGKPVPLSSCKITSI